MRHEDKTLDKRGFALPRCFPDIVVTGLHLCLHQKVLPSDFAPRACPVLRVEGKNQAKRRWLLP